MSVILNIVSAFDEKGIKKAQKAFSQLETNTQKAAYALQQYGGPAAIAVIGAVTAGLTQAVKAAAEDQKSQEQLKIALENTVGANKLQVAAVEDSITALMFQTATADDELRPALSALVRATGDVARAQSLLKLALDISAGSGRDLTSITTGLSKAALGNFTALKKLGIPLDQNAVKAKDLNNVLSSLATSFAGAATKNAQTFEGQITTLKISLGELQETVGNKILPTLSNYASVLVNLTTKTDGAQSSTKTWFNRLATGINFLAKNYPALGPLIKAIDFVNDKVKDQADYLKRLNSPTSNVTKVIKELTIAEDSSAKSTKASSAAKEKAAAAAKKHAAALAKAKETAAEFKRQTEEAAQALQDKLNAQLDDATAKLKDAQGAFDSFGKGVGYAITAGFDFGKAQSEAASNAEDLKKALANQAQAQLKVNAAYDKWNGFQDKDNLDALTESQRELAIATDEVAIAQAKPMTFFDNLAKQAEKAKKFGELVSRLIAQGLSETALSQVLQAGVDGGTAIAEEILGSADGVLKANDLTAGMTALADSMAAKSAAKYYQAGVDSAKSFLAGLQATMGISVPGNVDFSGINLSDVLSGINFGMGTLMANGGIVTRATTITAGEAGPEAIIPLDRLGSMGINGGMNITVQAGIVSTPDQIGMEIISAIQKAQRRSGQVFANAVGVAA